MISETIDLFAIKMPKDNDANAKTLGEYLLKLLLTLWDEKEGFSGKKPFGNSDWSFEIYQAMQDAKLLDPDSDGDLSDKEIAIADKMLAKALKQSILKLP